MLNVSAQRMLTPAIALIDLVELLLRKGNLRHLN